MLSQLDEYFFMIDFTNYFCSSLPVNIDSMAALEKINLSHNCLEHLPIAMGNLPKLRLVLFCL